MKFKILNSSLIELNTDSICIPYYKNNNKNTDLNSVNNLIDNLIEGILSESSWLLGDANNDSNLDIFDVVIIVNHIINQDAYNYFSDINLDSIINIQDIILLINIIIDN